MATYCGHPIKKIVKPPYNFNKHMVIVLHDTPMRVLAKHVLEDKDSPVVTPPQAPDKPTETPDKPTETPDKPLPPLDELMPDMELF